MDAERITAESHASFEGCEEELRALQSHAGNENPFLDIDWLKLWWRYFGCGKSLWLVLFRKGSRLVGWAPFYRVVRRGVGVIEYRFVGHGVSSYLDIICLPGYEEEVVEALFHHLETGADSSLLHLHDVNDRFSRCYRPLRERLLKRGADAAAFALYPCPIAELGKDWPAFFEQQRGKKSRYNLQRSERQLSELGRWKFAGVIDPAEISRLIPVMERLHRERFSDTVNPLFIGQRGAFIGSAISQLPGRRVSLSVVTLDDVPVSFLIGFKMGDVFVDYAPVFDPALSALSIGHIHLMRLMEKAIGEGFRFFDFSKGEAAYKRWWSNGETMNYAFRFGVHLKPAGRLYVKAVDAVLNIILALRMRGYNARIKQWIAAFRNVLLGAPGICKVEVRESLDEFKQASVGASPWSYDLIKDLPARARAVIVDLSLKLGPEGVRLVRRPEQKEVDLLSKNGECQYVVHY